VLILLQAFKGTKGRVLWESRFREMLLKFYLGGRKKALRINLGKEGLLRKEGLKEVPIRLEGLVKVPGLPF